MITAAAKRKCFDADQGVSHAKRVIEGLLKESSSTFGAKGETRQIHLILQSVLGKSVPSRFLVPQPIFNIPIPAVTDPTMLKELQTDSNKKALAKFHSDSDALATDNAAAAVFILQFVQEGSKSMNILMGDKSFSDMMKNGSLDSLVVANAIVSTHITNPGGIKGTDLEIGERRNAAHTALVNLKIDGVKIHEFANRLQQAVDDRDSETSPLSPLSELDKLTFFMGAVKKSPYYSDIYYGIMNLSLPTPTTTAELYQMCCRHFVKSPIGADGGAEMVHVLATSLDSSSNSDGNKKQLSNPTRRSRSRTTKTPGKQPDGSMWYDAAKWAAMSVEKRKSIAEQNAAAREKHKKQKKTDGESAKASSALLTTTSGGEFSDDDIDGPYSSRALLVAADSHDRSAKNSRMNSNVDMYDQFMMEYNNANNAASGRLTDSRTTNGTDSDDSEGNSSVDGSVSSDGSDGASSKLEHQLIQLLQYRAQQSTRGSQSVIRTHRSSESAIASGIGVPNDVPSTILVAQNCVDEIPPADIFSGPNDFHENCSFVRGFSSKSKGFSSLPAACPTTADGNLVNGGTGILSRLSWLFMVIAVVLAYSLGAMRNSGAAVASTTQQQVQLPPPPASSPPARKDGNPPTYHRVLMANKDDNNRTQKFNVFSRDNLVFDPGSSGVTLLLDEKYLDDIVSCESGSLGGINDNSSSLYYDRCGTIKGTHISNVVHCPGAIANILCPQSAIDQGYTQEYVSEGDYYTLTHPSDKNELKFGRVNLRNGGKTTLYLMDLRTLLPPIDRSLAIMSNYPTVAVTTTVAHNKARYTKREVMQADKARRFLGVMGNPSFRVAIEQIRSMRNAPVSEADVKRCIDIYGPNVASIKGHTTKKTAPAPRNDTTAPDEVPVHVYLEVDVMFVKGIQFLVSISLPLDYSMCVPLTKGRGARHLEKGLKAMVSKLKSRNFVCDSIRSDNEGGIAKQSTAEEIQRLGIELSLAGSGQHCAHIERRIRFIKEKYRGLEHGLPYAMNKILVIWAVLGSTRMTNMQRASSSTSLLTPREKFMGRPFDFDLDGRVEFGAYIQLTVRDTDNTSSARTEGCIALFPRDNLTGTIYAFHIATQAIVARDHFVELPISDAVISYIDKLAKNDGLSRGSEPFAVSEYGSPDDDEESKTNDAEEVNKPKTFKPFNEPSSGVIQQRAPSSFDGESINPLPEFPSSRGAVTRTEIASTLPTTPTARVTVEDVDDEAENDHDHDETTIGKQQQQHGSEFSTFSGSMSHGGSQQLPLPPTSHPTRASGAQLFRGRGAAQTNSLAGMMGSSALLVGADFNNPVFELKFKSQLHHTRDWHDRDFAFVISWKRAIKSYGEPARTSVEKELQQFIDKGVWHPVSFEGLSKQQRKAVIRAKMFVTEKFFPNGDFDKIKSRLVARGDMQDRSLYGDDDTSAPTAELSSVLSVAAIAACESRYVATCDIGGAFLNANMFKGSGRTVIVKLDPQITKMLTKLKPDYESFVGDDGHLFVELDKAMYGCIESAKLWYEHLRGVLVNDMGFVQNGYDQCTFNRTDDCGVQVTVILHVDDMKITCANKVTLEAVLISLCKRFKETKCHYGPCVPFLGMDFDYSIPGEVRITMLGMEADILATSGVTGVAKTPATETLFDIDTDKQPVEEQDEQDWFRSNVAKLLYLGKRARPEILTATTFLATRAAKADSDDMGKLRRVIRYLRGSAGRGIRLCPGALGVSVRAYVDAAYGVHMDGKSHTGVSIVIGEAGPIFVRSTKQPIVAKSSTEAELVATSDSANQVFHVRNFIIEQGYGDKPATIFQDNMSCMALMAKGKSTSLRTRHIQIRYFWVKERVDNGEAVVVHMKSEAMGPANALTKPLVGAQFLEERRQLTNWD